MASQDIVRHAEPAKARFINDPKVRGIVFQVVVVRRAVALASGGSSATRSKTCGAPTSRPASASCSGRAGFDISDSLIAYTSDSTYGRALLVGLLNTLLVAVAGIITATIIGFIVGIGRLSRNWLIRKICDRLCRGLPQYPAAAGHLLLVSRRAVGPAAAARQHRLPFGSFLNSRGFYFPRIVWGDGAWLILAGLRCWPSP